MNEPKHAHFVLSDAQYCHVLEDKLYIGKRELPAAFPKPNNRVDYLQLALVIAGLLVLGFFLVMTIIVDFYVVTFTLGALMLALILAFTRTIGQTTTKVIPRADILGVDYKKRLFGYDTFIIRYAGEHGKVWKRRLAIYDSQACLSQALEVMKSEGLLK